MIKLGPLVEVAQLIVFRRQSDRPVVLCRELGGEGSQTKFVIENASVLLAPILATKLVLSEISALSHYGNGGSEGNDGRIQIHLGKNRVCSGAHLKSSGGLLGAGNPSDVARMICSRTSVNRKLNLARLVVSYIKILKYT